MNIFRRVSQSFLTGIIFLLPFVATGLIVIWLVSFLAMYLGPGTVVGKSLGKIGMQFTQSSSLSYLFGWIAVLAFIILLGLFIENTSKRFITEWTDWLMKKIPAVGMIYGSTRQLVNLMDADNSSELQNMSPVYCRFGGTIFLALLPTSDEFVIQDNTYRAVIIPTAPVPFGGAVIMVPSSDVWDAKISVEQLLNFYVSMGISAKEYIQTRTASKKISLDNTIPDKISQNSDCQDKISSNDDSQDA